MRLSRSVAYALQATLQLARSDSEDPVPCSRLANDGKMPERFLLQVLRKLVAHGILHSTRGSEGGYVLRRPLEEISLLEVIEAIEAPTVPLLPPDTGLDEETRYRLEAAVRSATELARNELAAVKLAYLLPTTER